MKSNEQTYAVSLIVGGAVGPAARHGLNKVRLALQEKGVSFNEIGNLEAANGDILIVAGLADSSSTVSELLKASGMQAQKEAESLLIQNIEWKGQKTLLVSGGDDRGLMYALLDVADSIGWASDHKNPLSEVKDTLEKPAVIERAVSKYTMSRTHFESFFYNEDYWAKYLDMLARNRFNTFALLFAYESSGYFAPPYPYFFDMDGFPDVYVVGLTPEHQQRNLYELNRLIEMTHARGLNFTLGIWDHIYRGGVQRGAEHEGEGTLRWRVSGVTRDNLMDYSIAALIKLLELVPNLNAIQFRMHGESGLKKEEMGIFWENIYEIMKEHGKGIRFDARAKGFPDSLIDMAKDLGVNIRICTKYWMEQMGLPFHPTHIHPNNQKDRRHGYADLLRYPQRYKMHWRLWNGGTSRILLWGDPEYARRFAQSTHLYNGEGFEVNEPLATKMAGHSHDMEPFELLNPEYRYYDYEFERYWHFFQVFGRLGYNPETPDEPASGFISEVWEREFEGRFGKEAVPYVMKGLHLASKILPRIVAYNYPYNLFPTTRGWVERQRMEALPKYAEALPSDTQQFLSIDEAARNLLEGKESAKIHPKRASEWFAKIAGDVLELVDQAEQQQRIDKTTNEHKEFVSTMVDLRILANLALYHSRRTLAGLGWALFKHSGDVNALDDAIHHESQAIEAWEKIIAAAGDVYSHNLMMGRPSANLAGHWKDELVALQDGLKELTRQRKDLQPAVPEGKSPRPPLIKGEELMIAHIPTRKIAPGKDLVIRATVSRPTPITRVRVGYKTGQDEYTYTNLEQTEPFLYQAVIPVSAVSKGMNYFIEAVDETGQRVTYPSEGKAQPISVTVTDDNEPPVVTHTPITSARAGKPLTITAEVCDACGVKWVRLRYRSATQFEDFQSVPMLPTGIKDEYKAVVSGEHVDPKWDFMYLIEVMDNCGNGKIYPDLEAETPYVVVQLERD